MNESATCQAYVLPKLQLAGWDPDRIVEQYIFTDGRIVVAGNKTRRQKKLRADYLLRYTRDYPLAVVEAKKELKTPDQGLQQAKRYAEVLGLKFAYATNGHGIVEFDYYTGEERFVDTFPTPDELWARLRKGEGLDDDDIVQKLLTPSYMGDKEPRYYQQIAINRTLQKILQGEKRVLLTMATGTGKTQVAFQICWKLWNARWNRSGKYKRPKILYLADRNILIDRPKDLDFAPFDEARDRIQNHFINKGRDIYFAIYQALADRDENAGLYREISRDFFDLIIVDECHRGSARDESNWREVLEHFNTAYQLGMTATPKRDDNIDTYKYFGEPIYTYSLRQGIADGFLAPYHVHRVLTDFDAQGWRPGPAEIDRYGRTIPDKDYSTPDFERMVALRARSAALAHHLTDFLKKTGRSDKTVVFCVDQEHALEMRRQLTNLNADITQHNPNYVCRVTSDEGDFGLKHLDDFQQVEAKANGPVILTTSQMLTTGVDMPTCKNIVIARVINSMTEFKQIIGRGTRVREDYDKVYFNIIDYTDSAIRLLTDPAFDGDPVQITREVIDAQGEIASNIEVVRPTTAEDAAYVEDQENETEPFISAGESQEIKEQREKYYFDGGQATIVNESRYELDAEDQRLKLVQYTEYVAGKVRIVTPTLSALRTQWADPPQREQIIGYLKDRGIDLNELLNLARRPDADPFDLLCNITFNAPIHTRRERANRVLQEQQAFFEQYSIQARAVLETMLEKYAEHGPKQLNFDVFKLPSFAQYGKTEEITRIFGGIRQLRESVYQLQALLYTDAA